MELVIKKTNRVKGTIYVPGDKSLSHRALIFAALAEGESRITNLLTAADCLSTKDILRSLGVRIIDEGDLVKVAGVGLRGFKEPDDVLNVGNSGTTLRIMPGILAGQDFFSVLTGDSSVRSRPMARVIDPLRLMGAKITGRSRDTLAPIAVRGDHLRGISYATPVASAQIKTSILLAGLLAEGKTTVIENQKSRDHTERFFDYFEIENDRFEEDGGKATISVSGGQTFKGKDMAIAGDISSAAFFITAALIAERSDLVIVDVCLNPTRIGFLEALQQMGVEIEIIDQKVLSNEPAGTLRVTAKNLKAVQVEGAIIPRIIDELPILAVLATQAEGTTVVKDAAELRVKESDRISALTYELRKMGAEIEEEPDGFVIDGPTNLHGGVVDSHGDHRLAMSLAVAALVADGETVIKNAECVNISYPGFEDVLRRITG